MLPTMISTEERVAGALCRGGRAPSVGASISPFAIGMSGNTGPRVACDTWKLKLSQYQSHIIKRSS